MKDFKQLQIKIDPEQVGLIGNRIDIGNVFNEEIIIHSYKIADSKFPKPGRERCLHLQVELNGEMRVMFLTSTSLINVLERIPRDEFPFKTTIKKNQKRFEFT